MKELQTKLRGLSAGSLSQNDQELRGLSAGSLSQNDQELRDKLQAELDAIIAAECPLCGSVMIQSINKPFISKEEESEALLWSV